MERQVWQLPNGGGGWTSVGSIYRLGEDNYYIRNNSPLVDEQSGINQVYIYRASDGYHATHYHELDFDREDTIVPEDAILLKSFRLYSEEDHPQ